MSYFPRTSRPSAAHAMGDVINPGTGWAGSVPPPPPPPSQTKSSGTSGTSWWDRVAGAGSSVLDYFGKEQERKAKELELAIAQQRAMGQRSMPGWVLPAVAVAGVVGAVVLLRKK